MPIGCAELTRIFVHHPIHSQRLFGAPKLSAYPFDSKGNDNDAFCTAIALHIRSEISESNWFLS